MPLKAEVVGRIADVGAREWDALDCSGHPFTRHAFLATLESTGCVGEDTGWIPAHLVVRDSRRGTLVAAVPQYLKTHSWGEFVFDWSWAQSYLRSGLDYYPKQLAAIPFTPVTGPRMLIGGGPAGSAHPDLRDDLAGLLLETARRAGASGAHVNFTLEDDQAALERSGFLRRHDCRFLWRNRDYGTFEEFLATFRADKRKKARRERRKVADAGIVFRTLAGEDIDARLWRVVFGFSEKTFLRHGNGHYLNVEFLEQVSRALPGSVMVKLAERSGRAVAASIFFEGGGWLYGRYWGAAAPEDSLHFEACYYQGIEHCIERGLQFFDPGTQGEHKIARGFEPTRTLSAHWLEHAGFRSAVARYLERERDAIDAYIAAAAEHLPFQRTAAARDTA
ncbi:MAG TPA: GNAT family N-acetyltransferase [Steroidobacteraceae bacterium]|nr:GNAT family N-acetyltransferase [Steroidobacteraceae bacterium]